MYKFITEGVDQYRVEDIDMNQIRDTLVPATYSVGFNPQGGYFFLKKIDDFTLPSKLYGSEISRADRVLNTFLDRPAGTGVVLAGEKGSGKTLLAKKVSALGLSQGIPTIVVNNAYCGEGFNKFMQSIHQPCVVLFDEFEKVYDSKEQEALLTLLDGTMSSKKLWMVTINDIWKIDEFMKNRPGRFFYMFRYGGITEEVIRQYCEDVLKDKTQIDSVVGYSYLFNAFTFDMLVAIVEEMNRYDEAVREVVELVNANYEFDGGISFEIVAASLKSLKEGEELILNKSYVYGEINPINDEFTAYIYYNYDTGDGKGTRRETYGEYNFDPETDLVSNEKGVFTYENENARISIRRKQTKARRFQF